jgi:hypothetical protein
VFEFATLKTGVSASVTFRCTVGLDARRNTVDRLEISGGRHGRRAAHLVHRQHAEYGIRDVLDEYRRLGHPAISVALRGDSAVGTPFDCRRLSRSANGASSRSYDPGKTGRLVPHRCRRLSRIRPSAVRANPDDASHELSSGRIVGGRRIRRSRIFLHCGRITGASSTRATARGISVPNPFLGVMPHPRALRSSRVSLPIACGAEIPRRIRRRLEGSVDDSGIDSRVRRPSDRRPRECARHCSSAVLPGLHF